MEFLRSDSEYQSVVAVIILCIWKDFFLEFYLKEMFIKVSVFISFSLV